MAVALSNAAFCFDPRLIGKVKVKVKGKVKGKGRRKAEPYP